MKYPTMYKDYDFSLHALYNLAGSDCFQVEIMYMYLLTVIVYRKVRLKLYT